MRRQGLDFTALLEPIADRRSLYASVDLDLYQRLIQYFGLTTAAGGVPLDLVNFHRTLFPLVPSLAEVEALFSPEHGYGSPDGAAELGTLLTEYVRFRVRRYRRWLGRAEAGPDLVLHGALGTGTTGVMGCLLPAIRALARERGESRGRVVLVTPQYSVYDSIARHLGFEVEHLLVSATDRFLPRAEVLELVVRRRPLAVILTFPGNPAQTTYAAAAAPELERMVALCQETHTFLVIDNVYEDTLWAPAALNPEVLAFARDARWLAKVSGPSKDRAGASGLRVGYWVGDPRLSDHYLYHASLHSNTPNSASRCWLALELLLRWARLENRQLAEQDVDLLGDGVAGWGRALDRRGLLAQVQSTGLERRYARAVADVERRQMEAVRTLAGLARGLGVFAEVINDDIGNLLLLRVHPDVFGGDCHQLFVQVMRRSGVGILPGNAFGLPCVPGEAWFRMTVIHESVDELARRLEAVARALV